MVHWNSDLSQYINMVIFCSYVTAFTRGYLIFRHTQMMTIEKGRCRYLKKWLERPLPRELCDCWAAFPMDMYHMLAFGILVACCCRKRTSNPVLRCLMLQVFSSTLFPSSENDPNQDWVGLTHVASHRLLCPLEDLALYHCKCWNHFTSGLECEVFMFCLILLA